MPGAKLNFGKNDNRMDTPLKSIFFSHKLPLIRGDGTKTSHLMETGSLCPCFDYGICGSQGDGPLRILLSGAPVLVREGLGATWCKSGFCGVFV